MPKSEQGRSFVRHSTAIYGFNIRLGANAFLNYNSVILDVVEVSIGEGAQIGRPYRFTPRIIRAIRRSAVPV